MECKGDFWMDMHSSSSMRRGLSAVSVLENQGRGDFSSHDGSIPSGSSSSDRNSSTDLIDGDANVIALLKDGEVCAMLEDAEVRAVLRKVTINEGVLNKAIQSLGGGEKGLKILIGYMMVWVKQQGDIKSSSQQTSPPPPSNPAWNFPTAQDVFFQPSSDAFQILSDILQPLRTTQLLDQEVRYTQRLKSRKLMTGGFEMGAGLGGLDTGFCPSSFIRSPEDCKPEVTSPNIRAPCIPQLHYGMQQQHHHPVTPFTSAHIAMPSVEPTPAMSTKAARRHRMTRQRQSFHAPVAKAVARAPVSVGGGSLWNTNAATPPAVTSAGMSGSQTTPQSAPVTAAREKEAEQRMPFLATREGVSIHMEDFDSGQAWDLRYNVIPLPKMGSSPRVTSGTSSYWPNNKSRMYLLENTAAFVIAHGLEKGDLLVIYRILQGGYVLRGMKKKNEILDIESVRGEIAHSSAKGFLEGQPSQQESGTLVQRLYGCCPLDTSVKEEPVNLDDDPFLNDVIQSMDQSPSFESDSSCIQTLDRFPSSTLDFPFEEIMAVTDGPLNSEIRLPLTNFSTCHTI